MHFHVFTEEYNLHEIGSLVVLHNEPAYLIRPLPFEFFFHFASPQVTY